MNIQWALMPPLTGLEDLAIAEPSMYMYRCLYLYPVPVPYDPASDYVCPCVYLYLYQYLYPCPVSSKALGIEGPEYVYV